MKKLTWENYKNEEVAKEIINEMLNGVIEKHTGNEENIAKDSFMLGITAYVEFLEEAIERNNKQYQNELRLEGFNYCLQEIQRLNNEGDVE
jgi:hypothetical protein